MRTSKRIMTLGVGATTLGLAAPLAQSQSTDPEEVVVLGQRLEESIPLDLQQFGNRVEVITAEQLALGGFNDAAQALQMEVPGLYLAPKNGAFRLHGLLAAGLTLPGHPVAHRRRAHQQSPLQHDGAARYRACAHDRAHRGSLRRSRHFLRHSIGRRQSSTSSRNRSATSHKATSRSASTVTTAPTSTPITAAPSATTSTSSMHRKTKPMAFSPFLDSEYQPSGTDRDRGYDVLTVGAKYAYAFNDASELTLHYHHTDNEVEFAAPSTRARSFNERDEDLITV